MSIQPDSRIFVAGHRGLVGSAIVRKLQSAGYKNIITRTRHEADLRDFQSVSRLFREERPEAVILAAAKVGGIHANDSCPADFIYDNLAIQTNVIHNAHQAGVGHFLFLGSTCIYPRECPQPIREEYLLTGPLEETNRAYAIAKIAGYEMCRSYARQYGSKFLTLMPTNLYGPNDNFDPLTSHVLPGLIYKAHVAKVSGAEQLVLWGTGTPLREFLHVDDLADACIFSINQDNAPDLLNVGSGEEVSILDLAKIICDAVGFSGKLVFDSSMPDGTPRKLVDSSRIAQLGWRAKIKLENGIETTYQWFKQEVEYGRLSLQHCK